MKAKGEEQVLLASIFSGLNPKPRGRVARDHTVSPASLSRRLNPHLFSQTQLLGLKFCQRFFHLVRQAGNSFVVALGKSQAVGPGPSFASLISESALSSFFVSSFSPDFCDFEKLFTKDLLPPCTSSTASFRAATCWKTQPDHRPSRPTGADPAPVSSRPPCSSPATGTGMPGQA